MSRFVSAGTHVEPVEGDVQWLQAQQELEAARRVKQEQSRASDGKTLFEVLQANKAAKQEAFEEAAKLKNQFRCLDDDEVDFLDSVLESTRAQEAAVRKETVAQLELFRKQQEELERAALAEENETAPILESEESWQVGPKKRKRARDKEVLAGVKLRKSSSAASELVTPTLTNQTPGGMGSACTPAVKTPPALTSVTRGTSPTSTAKPQSKRPDATPKALPALALGLGNYSSDED